MITSTTNERIKALVRLRSRRHRDRTGHFLVEGYREITRALDAPLAIETLFVCPTLFLGGNEPALVDRARGTGAEIVDVAEAPFRKASYRERPEGLLAVALRFDTGLDRIELVGTPLVLVAQSIEKPGNLGTMLRTAAAAAVSGVIIADPTTDPFNPNVVRASLGHLFTVPLAVADTSAAIEHLRSHGVTIIATTPDAADPYYAADLTGPTALVVGSEQYGLSDEWLDAADRLVVIPMPGPADSLNAAAAAAVVLFEAVRQRRVGS
jgi:RNA methyltransferase, TrmH family